ncbi:MAG: 3-hydroxyacyl-CoA dehydrogenase [Polynucleobacter sp.]|uniref:3-hydroxyacyl-CoA dehydrogenase n=1 Tax=Polynucleobacter sp. TaxID=2029855 RepID=UPI002719E5CE|nr:3-hydroxyacyl-CoA dehydrogenase [Polynucleobacter sp.]MDO8713479.1 3-hydroxyacyl-CoA dehydrogenase [Polynucleobacter sp.]
MVRDFSVAVLGAGAMGRGIAQVFILANYEVKLFDAGPGVAEKTKQEISKQLHRLVEKNSIEEGVAKGALNRLVVVSSLDAIADVGLVIEAVIEDVEVKRVLFASLEAIVKQDCVLASNTSSLSISTLAAQCRFPERVAGFHFFNPVPLMRLVEVINGLRTSESTVELLERIGTEIGKVVVRVKDTPGFLVNQIGRAYTLEAINLIAEGVCSYADIDRVMKDTAGFRMGPFELLDLVGLDVNHPATEAIYSQFYNEPRYRPSSLMEGRLRAGLLGRKTQAGFYKYEDGKPVVEIEELLNTEAANMTPIWVSEDEAAESKVVIEYLKEKNILIETSENPSLTALCIITPLGEDASRCAARQGLDPTRTVAIDTLLGLDKRRTLMKTCVTTDAYLGIARAIFSIDKVPVTVIKDSPGFISQRILAMIINLGTSLAQARTASPEDIDKAVKLALAYPKGPLEFGNSLGIKRMGKIIENIYQQHLDPRYRPNLWLARRIALGISLHDGN